jgi:hypothetical protein
MKTHLPGNFAIGRILGILMLILFFRNLAHAQATAPIKWGNSYVNLSKKTVGGPVMPGDTLEIRTNFYVNGTYNGTGKMFDVRYLDNIPTNTTILPNDSLRLVTNEGLTFRHYTYATGDDAGSYVAVPVLPGDYQIRINMGATPAIPNGADPMGIVNINGASTVQGNVSKPLFGGGSIISTGFRVVVTGTYGDTITLGAGVIRYRQTAGTLTDTVLKATQYKILITAPTTLCSSTTSTNFAAEFGGTFGTGSGRNRGVGPSFLIPNYTYLPNSGTAPSINDGYYAIVNNISPVSSTFPGAALMNSCAGFTGVNACSNREFNGFWDISGDHTGSVTPAGNPPPSNTTSSGYMLVVNADLATSEAYHQVISGLCPNTYYQFSAWVKNICPNCGIDSNGTPEYLQGVLPNLTLVVDSIDRLSTGALDHSAGWQQRGFVFLTGPAETSITISIRNNAPGGGGNDWALDDISLATCPPSLLLTPDKPDTLCYGADDTVRFAISSYVNNYTQWQLNKSIDGGSTWVPAGLDTLHRADTGTVVPQYNPITGLYADTVTRYFQVPATTALTIYQLVVASTVSNLASSTCAYTTAQPKYVVGVNCMIALPTTLLSFRGQLQNNGLANLQWTTTGEVPGLQFTVERSDDGVHYTAIGTLPGTAVPGEGASYQFTDPTAVAAQSYYRIQLTSNSISQYSGLVLLSNSSISFQIRSVQNPFIDQINMEMTAPSTGTATITLIDLFGRSLRRVIQPVNQGMNSINLYGLGNLPAATYALQIQYGDHLVSQKLVKVDK